MNPIPSSVPPPKTFCSPGLERVIVKLSLVLQDELESVRRNKKNQQAITALAERKLLSIDKALPLIAKELSVELIDFSEGHASREDSKPLIDKLGHETAIACRILPLSIEQGFVRCAMSDPLDIECIKQAEFLLESAVHPVLCRENQLIDELRLLQGEDAFSGKEFDQIESTESGDSSVEVLVTETKEASDKSGGAANAPPIVRLVNRVLADAARVDASDIHMLPTSSNLEIKFRIDGIMQPHLVIPKRLQSYIVSRIKLLSKMDIAERRRPQDGRFRMRVGKNEVRDLRVSSVPTPFGEKLVLRILKPQLQGVALETSGLPPDTLKRLKRALKGTDRIILVVGPTGSGKSTTLYSALNSVNTGSNTIITVEDPIEYRLEGATQIEVDSKIGMTFASGLRSILRQDPDVILVGEIRDLETAEIAFQAAQTGHLVLSTLHTNDAASAVIRLRDIGLESYIIAGSLSAVLAQRLVRKLCSHCKRPARAEELREVNERYGVEFSDLSVPVGCPECNRTGFSGRLGVFSLLEISAEIRDLIRSEQGESKIDAAGRAYGMRTLGQAALDIVLNQVTSIEEAERVIGESSIREAAEMREKGPSSAAAPREEALEAPSAAQPQSSPTQSTKSAASIASLAEAMNTVSSGDSQDERIIIVDDDRGVRAVMAASLRKAGFEVTEASNGEEALSVLGNNTFDAMVCDLDMPKMDGKQLLAAMRADPELAKLPVLMLTGWDSEEKELDLIKTGANDFVSKSSSPALVIARLRRILN